MVRVSFGVQVRFLSELVEKVLVSLKLDLSLHEWSRFTHVSLTEVRYGHEVNVFSFIVKWTVTHFIPPTNHNFSWLSLLQNTFVVCTRSNVLALLDTRHCFYKVELSSKLPIRGLLLVNHLCIYAVFKGRKRLQWISELGRVVNVNFVCLIIWRFRGIGSRSQTFDNRIIFSSFDTFSLNCLLLSLFFIQIRKVFSSFLSDFSVILKIFYGWLRRFLLF